MIESEQYATMLRRGLISVLLLITVAIAATVLHLYLHRAAWIEQGESAILWDWVYAMQDGLIPFAVAQYVAVAGAFALAWVLRLSEWRLLRRLLVAWGITWLPVAIVSTGDVTASSAGPFNFPMSMFAAPIFAFFCLVELGVALLIRAISIHRSKVNPIAERLEQSRASSPEQD